jgi:hypothetical protein
VLCSPFSLPGAASPSTDITTRAALCHASFPLNQDEFAASTSSSSNASSRRPPLEPKPKHWIRCYKMIISTLATLPTIQSRLHFASSLAKAPHHQSSTRRRCSFLSLSHTHRHSTQWHSHWWTSWPYFAFWTTYRYVNLHKKIF